MFQTEGFNFLWIERSEILDDFFFYFVNQTTLKSLLQLEGEIQSLKNSSEAKSEENSNPSLQNMF